MTRKKGQNQRLMLSLCEQIDVMDILEFIDISAEGGDLAGNGSGQSAESHLHTVRSMIESTGRLVEDDFIQKACEELQGIFDCICGSPTKPGLLKGPATVELLRMILDLVAGMEWNRQHVGPLATFG